jgi:membrane protease YdiL (CAAX protease family)
MNNKENIQMKNQKEKFKLFFLLRLVIAMLFVGLSFGLYAVFKILLKNLGFYDLLLGRIISMIGMIALVYFGYFLYLRFFENRKPTEYSKKGWAQELAKGMGLGSGLITIQIVILWIMNAYHIDDVVVTTGIISIFIISVLTGFLEELLNKGIIFRILEEGLGSWIALLVVALEVGITHISNTGATAFSTIAVSIEFGIMLSLFYMVTRRLWLVTGFHFAWNFTMGGIFGINVSGLETKGLISSNLQGHQLFTGGDFGIEATIPAIMICSIITILLVYYVTKKNLVVKPMWSKQSD